MDTKQVKIYPSKLNGEINITGAKNAVLRHLAASILADEPLKLENYPQNMLDVSLHEEMLQYLGKTVVHDRNYAIIDGKVNKSELLWDKRSIRNTLLILGALLTKTGYGKVPLPGGCDLGDRKYDIHVSDWQPLHIDIYLLAILRLPLPGGCDLGDRKYDIHVGLMRAMGAEVWQEDKYLCAKVANRLHGCEYTFPIRSTGATENAMIMASLAEGTTKIWNPHIRPEILDLAQLLRQLGAKITINGQESIEIIGVKSLRGGISHFIVGDSLQAFTYLIAGAIGGNELIIRNFPFE